MDILLQFGFRPGQCHPTAQPLQDELCCFNDDIQGTAAVTLGSLIAACKPPVPSSPKRVAFLGAGSAGCEASPEQIVAQMKAEG